MTHPSSVSSSHHQLLVVLIPLLLFLLPPLPHPNHHFRDLVPVGHQRLYYMPPPTTTTTTITTTYSSSYSPLVVPCTSASSKALAHTNIPWAILRGNPKSLAEVGLIWIGFQSPDTWSGWREKEKEKERGRRKRDGGE